MSQKSATPPRTWKGSYAYHLGMHYDHVAPGIARATLSLQSKHCNPNGVCHGGAIFTFADDSMGAALHDLGPAGHHPVSTQVNIHFMRSCKAGDRLQLETNIVTSGKRAAVAETRVMDADGRVVALVTASYLFVEKR